MTNIFLIGKKILNTFKISTDRLRDGAVGPPVAGLGVLVLGVRPGSARHGAAAPPPVPPLRGVRHLVAALESFYRAIELMVGATRALAPAPPRSTMRDHFVTF